MAHDSNGQRINKGDIVFVACRVKDVISEAVDPMRDEEVNDRGQNLNLEVVPLDAAVSDCVHRPVFSCNSKLVRADFSLDEQEPPPNVADDAEAVYLGNNRARLLSERARAAKQ